MFFIGQDGVVSSRTACWGSIRFRGLGPQSSPGGSPPCERFYCSRQLIFIDSSWVGPIEITACVPGCAVQSVVAFVVLSVLDIFGEVLRSNISSYYERLPVEPRVLDRAGAPPRCRHHIAAVEG